MVFDRLSEQPAIDLTATVRDSKLGRYAEVGARTSIVETELDDYSYVVDDSDIIYSRIGKFCSIAAHVRINPGNPRLGEQARLISPIGRLDESDETPFFDWRRAHPVTVGHDAWIGHGAVVLPGRSIGTGSVIAAGAVVARDVAPYTIVAGVPARPVKRRFSSEVADRLIALAWWDWDHERLRAALADFRKLSAEAFL